MPGNTSGLALVTAEHLYFLHSPIEQRDERDEKSSKETSWLGVSEPDVKQLDQLISRGRQKPIAVAIKFNVNDCALVSVKSRYILFRFCVP